MGAGAAILEFAEVHGIDLVVMGAYGHSRWREMLLGGVTRHLMQRSTIPVIMSH